MVKKEYTISIKKIIISVIIISSLVFLFLWNTPFTHQIDTTAKALMICGANTEEAIVEIKIKGDYTTRFFKDDNFTGSFIIDGFEITKELNKVYINMGDGHLIYRGYNGSVLKTHSFGFIYADKYFKNFVILPFQEYIDDSSYKGSSGSLEMRGETITAICYPSETRCEAVKMVNSKLNKYPGFQMK